MSRFINPFTDVGFKKIFGQEINKDLLISFLNNLLKGERVINDLRFLDKEQMPEMGSSRGLVFDVFCETSDGENIIVEMQLKGQDYFKDRAIFYMSQGIIRQGVRGKEWNYKVHAVYGVFIMNFHDGQNFRKFRTDVGLLDMKTHELFSDRIRMIFLQMPVFNKEPAQCRTLFDRWIYVLKNMEVLDRMPWEARIAVFKKLANVASTAALTPEERDKYDYSLKKIRDELSIMSYERKQGLAEGRAEEKLSIAKSLKAAGVPIEVITESTGLSAEEVMALE
jgi:predicted transposase/invertase (TIGR01784 family)